MSAIIAAPTIRLVSHLTRKSRSSRWAGSSSPDRGAAGVPDAAPASGAGPTAYPACSTAAPRRSMVATAGSKTTRALAAARLTIASLTPSTRRRDFSIRRTHEAHVIPSMGRSTVAVAARVSAVIASSGLRGAAAVRPGVPAAVFENLEQFRDGALALAGIVRPDRTGHAVVEVPLEQQGRGLVDGALHGADLFDDVDAIPVLVDHPDDRAPVPLDAAQPRENLRLGVRVEAGHGSRHGYFPSLPPGGGLLTG